jgi:dephospho-CoA kinase
MIIGLTGGIASGKSQAANFFAELGIVVIDTDHIAREVVSKDQIAYQQIITHFGNDLLTANQEINRKKLREIIFNSQENKQWLENLLHPIIRAESAKQIKQSKSAYSILVIPLLFETWPNPLADRVLVIDCLPETQLARLLERDSISAELAKKIIEQQASREQRLSIADDIIENNESIEQLRQNVLKMHNFYLGMTADFTL